MSRSFPVRVLGVAFALQASVASAASSGLLSAHMPHLLTPEQQTQIEIGGYTDAIRSRIVSDQRYPGEALANAWEGTAEVRLVIGTDGQVKGAWIAASSGHPVLDVEAVAKARALTALPSPPRFLQGRAFTLAVPVVFRLER